MSDENFSHEKATELVDDWWEMFEFPENPMFQQVLITLLKKYPTNVVTKTAKHIMMEMRYKYLPQIGMIKSQLDENLLSDKKENKTKNYVESMFRHDNPDDPDQKVWFNGVKNQLKRLKEKEISQDEYILIQANWFEKKGMKEDADYCRDMADRVKKGKPIIHSEEWNKK